MRLFIRSIILSAIAIVCCSTVAYAQTTTYYGRAQSYGYFDGTYEPVSSGDMLYPEGLTITGTTEADKVASFIATLRTHNLSTADAHHRTATAFIVSNMLGKTAPPARPISDTDIDALQARLSTFVSSGGTITYYPAYTYNVDTYYQLSKDDVAWYGGTGTDAAYVFSKRGVDYFAIRQLTGGPLNGLSAIPAVAAGWTASGVTTVSNPTPQPGETISFRHVLTNQGPDNIPAGGISYRLTTTSPSFSSTPYASAGAIAASNSVTFTDNVTIPAGTPAGTRFCQRISWQPNASASPGSTGSSTVVCADVITGFNIVPTVEASQTTALSGEDVTFKMYVDNTGTNTNEKVNVYVKKITFSGASMPSDWASQRHGWDCTAYLTKLPAGVTKTCDQTTRLTPAGGQALAGSQRWPSPDYTETLTLTGSPGYTVCRILFVTPYTNTSGTQNRNSPARCITVGTAPYMALIGADSSAGGATGTRPSPCENTTNPITSTTRGVQGFLASRLGTVPNQFGSFTDYGLFSVGPILDFSSSGKIDDASYQRLTFANIGTFTTPDSSMQLTNAKGYFYNQGQHCIADYINLYYDQVVNGPNTVTDLAPIGWNTTKNYYYSSSSAESIDLTTGIVNIPENVRVIIYAPDKTININHNISYVSGTFSSFSTVPRLTVIAKDIMVSGDVTQLDGIFYATNYFNTCAEATNNPNDPITGRPALVLNGPCSKQLIINGAVIAYNTVFPRTYGGTAPNQPAEIIRMRPDAFLQPYAEATNNQFMITDFETELPPRY